MAFAIAWLAGLVAAQEEETVVCTTPTTPGYDVSEVNLDLGADAFQVSVACADGYIEHSGPAQAIGCTESGPYTVTGCIAEGCTLATVNPAEGQRSYSSTHNNARAGTGLAVSMLDSPASWSTGVHTGVQWMQMDLGRNRYVSQIVSRGRGDVTNQWVTQYKVQHSTDGITFAEVPAVFEGNHDPGTKVYAALPEPVLARYVRLVPTAWFNYMSMRAAVVEVACTEASSLAFFMEHKPVGRQPVAQTWADSRQNTQYIDTSSSFDASATIVGWEYYAKSVGTHRLEVWRPVSANTWRLVCQNSVAAASSDTVVRHTISSVDQCMVRPGDTIGWHHPGPGIIAYAESAEPSAGLVVWADGNPMAVGADRSISAVLRRDYSIRALWEPAAEELPGLAIPSMPATLSFDLDAVWYRCFTARNGGTNTPSDARVMSLVDGNELFKDGVSVGIFNKGQRWVGVTRAFDEFYATGPIYGMYTRRNLAGDTIGQHPMTAGRLKGRQFSFHNWRRADLLLWARALETNVVCAIMTTTEVLDTVSIGAGDGFKFSSVDYGQVPAGENQIVKVACDADITLAAGERQQGEEVSEAVGIDYIIVPPEATEWYGMVSSALSVSQSTGEDLEVTEKCSSGNSPRTFVVPGSTGAFFSAGQFQNHFQGAACIWSASRPFSVMSASDGDGTDSVFLLSTAQGSTTFSTNANSDLIAVAALEPGSCSCTNDVTVDVSECGNGVCRGRTGPTGIGNSDTCDCSSPMWTAFDTNRLNDEQLGYGDLPFLGENRSQTPPQEAPTFVGCWTRREGIPGWPAYSTAPGSDTYYTPGGARLPAGLYHQQKVARCAQLCAGAPMSDGQHRLGGGYRSFSIFDSTACFCSSRLGSRKGSTGQTEAAALATGCKSMLYTLPRPDKRFQLLLATDAYRQHGCQSVQLLNPPEQSRSYSSVWANDAAGTGHARSMLDSPQGWSNAGNEGPAWLRDWMQIDLGSAKYIAGIVVQGRVANIQWPTQYKIQHSLDGIVFAELPETFVGTSDADTRAYATLRTPLQARYVRILPKAWVGRPSMRAGIVEAVCPSSTTYFRTSCQSWAEARLECQAGGGMVAFYRLSFPACARGI